MKAEGKKQSTSEAITHAALGTVLFYTVALVVVLVYADIRQNLYKKEIAKIKAKYEDREGEGDQDEPLTTKREWYPVEEVERIVKAEQKLTLDHTELSEVGELLQDEEQYNRISKDLHEFVIGSSKRPAAHLTCKNPPVPNGGSDEYKMKWRSETGGGSVFKQSIHYNDNVGQVTMKKGAKYNIHLHTSFNCRERSDKSVQEVSHAVVLVSNGHHNYTTLMDSSKWLTSNSQKETLDSSVVQQLGKGDKLEVHLRLPNGVKVLSRQCETYFDIFMV